MTHSISLLTQWFSYVVCTMPTQIHISKIFIYYSKMELSSSSTTNIRIDKPAKAPIQLSEGWWFGPTHGFYTFTHPK